jgi:hypothetical protein
MSNVRRQETMDVETFCAAIAPLLKMNGFKTQRLNWRKDFGASIAVFNVQISSWGDRSYYLNLGAYLKLLGGESTPPSYRCHVQERLKQGDPHLAVSEAMDWFSDRKDVQALRELQRSGRLLGKRLVFKEVVSAVAA